jgi:putative component of toxin-antitoxin plasmid stabilization module
MVERTIGERNVLAGFREFNLYSPHQVSLQKIKEMLPSVSGGDFRELDNKPGFMTWARWMRTWAPLIVSPSVLCANRDICAPLLREACESGNGSLLEDYFRRRLLVCSSLPPWSKGLIGESHLELSTAMQELRGAARRSPLEEKRELFLRSSPIAVFPLGVTSKGLEEGNSLQFEKHLYNRIRKEGNHSSLLSRTEFDMQRADRELEKHHELAQFLGRLRFFTDIASTYDIPEPAKHLGKWLTNTTPLSEVITTQPFRRTIQAAIACEEFPAVRDRFGALVICKNPRSAAQQILEQNRSASKTEAQAPDGVQSQEHHGSSAALELLLGVRQTVQTYCSHLPDSHQIARQLHGLLRRGLLSYAEIVESLSQGAGPAELILRGRSRTEVAAGQIGASGTNEPSGGALVMPSVQSSPSPLRSSNDMVENTERAVFFCSQAALASLESFEGSSTLRLVQQRLARMSLGELLEHSTINGEIKQLKIHHGSGTRIFYKELPDGAFLILGIAKKSDQQDSINRIKKLSLKPRFYIRYL